MRIIKYILLLFVLFSWGGRSQAQEQDNSTEGQRIVGLVLDANTREPLESVQVSSADLVRAVVSGPPWIFQRKNLVRYGRAQYGERRLLYSPYQSVGTGQCGSLYAEYR